MISLKKAFVALMVTTILLGIMFTITANGWLVILLTPILMLVSLLVGLTGKIYPWVKVTKIVAVIITAIILILCAKFFKVKTEENEPDEFAQIQTEATDNIQEEEEEKKEEQDSEEDTNTNAGKVTSTGSYNRKKLNNPFGDNLNVSFEGGSATDKTAPSGSNVLQGSGVFNATTGSAELTEEQDKQLQEDIEIGKNVEKHPSGVITTSDDKTEKEEDKTPQNPNLDKTESEDASTTPESETPNDPVKPGELSDEKLQGYGTTEDNKDKQDEETQEKPEDGNQDKTEDEEKNYTPVSITVEPTAYAGDTVQFFVKGDVETVKGYDGIDATSVKNGVISINTPDKTQTITITVIGKDGSTASATCTVTKIGEAVDSSQETEPVEDEKQEENNITEPVEDEKTPVIEENTKPEQDLDSNESESKPVSNPVSVQSLSGNTAYAGDSVQFKVSGDVESIEGTDGLNVSQTGDVITVETNSDEATVIDITVNGIDGSQASATVTVNVPFENAA